METLKVGDLVVHDQNKKDVLKIVYVYSTEPKCIVTDLSSPNNKFEVCTKNLKLLSRAIPVEHNAIISTLNGTIIGFLVKIPGYEAFILIDGKPFQLKKDDNEL